MLLDQWARFYVLLDTPSNTRFPSGVVVTFNYSIITRHMDYLSSSSFAEDALIHVNFYNYKFFLFNKFTYMNTFYIRYKLTISTGSIIQYLKDVRIIHVICLFIYESLNNIKFIYKMNYFYIRYTVIVFVGFRTHCLFFCFLLLSFYIHVRFSLFLYTSNMSYSLFYDNSICIQCNTIPFYYTVLMNTTIIILNKYNYKL